MKKYHSKIFLVRFLFSSSSLAALKRCGAFLIVLMTFFTVGIDFSVTDRRPLPPISTIVGNVELLLLLLRFNDPKRNERDNERESGLNFFNVDACEELGDDSATFFSSSVVSNLSNSAISLVFGGILVGELLDPIEQLPRASESYFKGIVMRILIACEVGYD
jgi:hypothetical protein